MTCPTPYKRRFGDAPTAESYRDNLALKGKTVDTRAYQCGCGDWHLASVDTARARRRKARKQGR